MRLLRERRSLTFNAMSLMTATIATNALGLVFWTEAARIGTPRVVGRAAAAIAALTLLATISQLNLTNVFVRLLPSAGRLGRRLIARGYLAVVMLSLVVGAVYVFSGLGDGVVRGGIATKLAFVIAVPVLAVFALQDSVLTALRRAPWVAAENISFATGKLALLPALLLLPIGRRDRDLVGGAGRGGGRRRQRAAVSSACCAGWSDVDGTLPCSPASYVVRRGRVRGGRLGHRRDPADATDRRLAARAGAGRVLHTAVADLDGNHAAAVERGIRVRRRAGGKSRAFRRAAAAHAACCGPASSPRLWWCACSPPDRCCHWPAVPTPLKEPSCSA